MEVDKDGRLLLQRTEEERKPIVERLKRIEGQVRGLMAMIEDDRYCGDELLQIKAVISALRRVAVIISEQHIAAAAKQLENKKLKATAVEDIKRVLNTALDL